MNKSSRKKLMLLGGLRYLLPVIEAAHQQGYYVITCDYIPDNIAHKYSDEYHNVSIIDKETVLALARELHIDGIMSFAVDPGVITAAYVAEQMKLPQAGPYESICILQNKDQFRSFLADNDFNVPKAGSYTNYKEVKKEISNFRFPIIVKPTDSAGSKGVSRVDSAECFEDAFYYAKKHSISGKVIVEEFIEKQGCASDSDCFSIEGKLQFVSFSAQRFDESALNPYVPSAFSWPSTMTAEQEAELTLELQRLLKLLKMETTVYNIETRIGKDGKAYIMEVSPRGGGNRLSEMLKYATGIDLITNAVRAAVGDKVISIPQKSYNGYWAEIILHSNEAGIFDHLNISSDLENYIVEKDLWVKKGDKITSFLGANHSLGTLVMKFPGPNVLKEVMDNRNDKIKISVK